MQKLNEYLPPVLNGITGILIVFICIFFETRIQLISSLFKPLGLILIALGMAIVIWAGLHIRNAIMGEVMPVLKQLVQDGPYAFVRHPVYLGMTIAMTGVAVSTRNWLGFILVFILFLPSEIYRARLEDRALHNQFGEVWQKYADRTGFMFPGKNKKVKNV